jgi:hypothetical protein
MAAEPTVLVLPQLTSDPYKQDRRPFRDQLQDRRSDYLSNLDQDEKGVSSWTNPPVTPI